mmetsp:Transcript_48455/g.114406  ORF Transcript_48455/g.114406 Transcript_48455/m.114406 type:complete len:478 (+) Transcript_48455:93-1526(+)
MNAPGRISWADLASDESESGGSALNSPEQDRRRASKQEENAGKNEEIANKENVNTLLSDTLDKLQALYRKRDKLFNVEPEERMKQLLPQQTELIAALEQIGEGSTPHERAQLHYIRGKTLDIDDEHVPKAEEALSKAVKLDSSLGDAWNQLGLSFWKKGDVSTAHDCWQSTLVHSSSLEDVKNAMRELSMVYRVKGGDPTESLRIAKDLIARDMGDEKSWSNLGNAYMSFFFASSLDRDDLLRALKAYTRSQACGESSDPDLHYNKATVFRYLEDYQNAIGELQRAAALDPHLQAADSVRQIEELVGEMEGMMRRRCNLQAHRLDNMLLALPPVSDPLVVGNAEYKLTSAAELKEGSNEGKGVRGLLLATPNTDGPIRQLVVAERGGSICAVSVYNMRHAKLKPGDVVTTLAPFLRVCSLPNAPDVSYRCLQVSPSSLLHNGRSCDTSYYLRPTAIFTANPATAPLPPSPKQPSAAM